ncbi:MAG: hypothetical protein E7013_04715 [Alphaproteobacteria bacterium]|nr:hypothetical protein [Alphaproteobacteria bacterium]
MSKTMFEKIKKRNGEAFAKAISAYDNGIFDIPNIDKIVYYAGRQAEPIMNYLISLKNIKIKENQTQETPMELLKKKGYNAYYADTLQKQNAIRKYFAPGEGLCTFGDAHRFEKFYIVNAVKENVDEIKRKDFSVPCREDEYGRSVISIQILKTGGFISIKNRYNHAVENSDNTFGSDPDEIIDGLAQSLRNYFHVDFSSKQCFLPNGYVSFNGMILKYHTESNNFYFGEDGYMYKGNFYPINKDYEMIIENMIFNLKDKTITFPDHSAECTGSILESEIKSFRS